MRFGTLILFIILTLTGQFLLGRPAMKTTANPVKCAFYTGKEKVEYRGLVVSSRENTNLSNLLTGFKKKYRKEFYKRYYLKWQKAGKIKMDDCPNNETESNFHFKSAGLQ